MTFVAYFQNGCYPTGTTTLGGMPFGESPRIPRFVLTDIITGVPEGTTNEMFEEKWGPQSTSSIQLDFCAPSECPDSVKRQMEAPNLDVRHRVWKSL
jgi:hypothetical protein